MIKRLDRDHQILLWLCKEDKELHQNNYWPRSRLLETRLGTYLKTSDTFVHVNSFWGVKAI